MTTTVHYIYGPTVTDQYLVCPPITLCSGHSWHNE